MPERRSFKGQQRRAQSVAQRRAGLAATAPRTNCTIVGCDSETMAAAGLGFTGRYCRPHIIHASIHGDPERKSIPPRIIFHLRMAAERWVLRHRERPDVQHALTELSGLYYLAGRRYENAYSLRLKRPHVRALNIVARWNAKGISRERVLATWVAAELALALDSQAPHPPLYQEVQLGKALHRLSSGTVLKRSDGSVYARRYPASRGRVLRHLGTLVAKRCSGVAPILMTILEEMQARSRPPSRLSQSIDYLKAPCVHRFVPGEAGSSVYARVRIETASGKPLDEVR